MSLLLAEMEFGEKFRSEKNSAYVAQTAIIF
jgi:hypothetical protein